jgi:uncharacterized protein
MMNINRYQYSKTTPSPQHTTENSNPEIHTYMKSFFISIALVVPFCSLAQSSVLWEIKRDDLAFPSYLMGTIKFVGEKEYVLPSEAVEKIQKSKIFAIEDPVDHHAQHELNKALHFRHGQSLKTVLSPEEYESVLVFFEEQFEITRSKFESKYQKLIPLALSITMTRLALGERVKYFDIELLRVAKANNIPTYSLEKMEREAEAIQRYPMNDQVKALLKSIENFDQQKNEFRMLMMNYPHGSLEDITRYTLHPVDDNPVFIEEFYTKRNLEWLPKIEKMIRDKPAFIALGISHLEGEQGILALLKSKGYTLSAVPLQQQRP